MNEQNQKTKRVMENLKELLEVAEGYLLTAKIDNQKDLDQYVNYFVGIEGCYKCEVLLYNSISDAADRDMETLAMITVVGLRIDDCRKKVFEIHRGFKPEEKKGNGLSSLLNAIRGLGVDDVAVVDLKDLTSKDHDCDNPDCPIHGSSKKDVKEDQKN